MKAGEHPTSQGLRVLWITSVPFPAATGGASMRGGGWMEGWRWTLEAHHPDVELAILSRGAAQHDPITVGNATFYSFPRVPGNRYSGVRGRWQCRDWADRGQNKRETVEAVIAQFRPEIVHIHGSESGLGKLAVGVTLPVLVSLQGVATVWQRFIFAGSSWTEVAAELVRPQFYRGYSHLHSYMAMRKRAAVEQETMSHCRYALGNTEWDRAVAATLCPSATYYHADRAVRQEFYSGEWAPPAPGSDPVLYCTGSAAPYKGFETLLEALSLLREAGETRVRARISGPVDRGSHWPALRRMTTRLGLADNVEWLGSIDAPEIVSEIEKASVFVQPSHIENESNVLIEAMLVGAPCVAARVGGIPSILRDGVDGLLYHDRDPYALAGALRTLLADPELASSLAASGREAAHRRHDPVSVADQLVEVYSSVIRDHDQTG